MKICSPNNSRVNNPLFRLSGIMTLCLCLACLPCEAHGATPESSTSAQSVRSPVNTGGPEDWPENEGLSTSIRPGASPARFQPRPASRPAPPDTMSVQADTFPAQPVSGNRESAAIPAPGPEPAMELPDPQTTAAGAQFSASPDTRPQQVNAPTPETRLPQGAASGVSGAPASGNVGVQIGDARPPEPAASPDVIYVDEAGNPVPKPLDPEAMLREARELMEQDKYDDALPVLERIRQIPGVPRQILESALYGISDCQWARYADNPLAGYEPIVSSTNEALNANIRSSRVPDALLRLGLAEINVGNLGDAGGYIVALMRRFPDFPGVAQGFTALGEAQLKAGKYAEAEQSFNVVLDKYPESSQLQAASVGLARALVHQNKDQRAQVIMDFISKRWPRYYINDPDFLLMQAANDEKTGDKNGAMGLRWLYVNIDPTRQANPPLMLEMGDDYMKAGQPEAAAFVYRNIVENFPDSPAAVTSRLRLAEKGIYDAPVTYAQISGIFSKEQQPNLWQVYNELVANYPNAPESVLARLKQAMWLYWDKQYPEAMGKAADFIDDYPENEEIPEARDLLWNAFQKELEQSLAEHNFGRILLLWNGFPFIRERYGRIDAPLRYALAQGWLERGDEQKSFELLADFLKDPMDPDYGEAAFSQFFNHYLQMGAWDKILDLGNLVRNWKMKPELENQLEYAMALSSQNLNLGASALNRWKRLAPRTDIPLYQQAYATYFLARDAENRRDIKNAYENNRKVVEMFTQLSEERSDKADPERIREAIASLMDICEVGNRVPEALQWVDRYKNFINDDSAEYPGLRFREARLYRKLGDFARAQTLLEDITNKYPDSPFAQAAAGELRTFDVSRDLERFMPQAEEDSAGAKGSTSGNWSSTAPAQTGN